MIPKGPNNKYVFFFAETVQAKLHHCDIILHTILKTGTWVTAGASLKRGGGGSEKDVKWSWILSVRFMYSYYLHVHHRFPGTLLSLLNQSFKQC